LCANGFEVLIDIEKGGEIMKTDKMQTGASRTNEQSGSLEGAARKNVKALIVFFSGTGNTQFIAEYIRDHVLDICPFPNYMITLAAMEWASPAIIDTYDLVCLGYPVYEGRAPKNVRDFIERLPVIHDKGVFVFNTKGLAQGRANRSIMLRLVGKGFRSLGCASLVLPASDAISMFLKKDSRKFREYLHQDFSRIDDVDKLVAQISAAIRILQENRDMHDIPCQSAVTILGFFITGLFRLLYLAFGRSMAKRLHTTEACTRCGLCAEQCPIGNITKDEQGISFGDRCILCLRCVNNCPQEAVQVGNLSIGKARWHGPGGGYKPLRYKTPKTFAPQK
jgi:ferredoxin